MPANDPNHLIGGHIMGTLTKSEASQLAHAALDDDAFMKELFDAQPLRDALEDQEFRARLKATLKAQKSEHPSLLDRLSDFFSQRWAFPAVGLALGAVAAGIFVFISLRPDNRDQSQVPVARSAPAGDIKSAGIVPLFGPELERWRRVQESPPARKAKASLEFNRESGLPSYAIGDQQRLNLRIEEEARVVVLEERADGSIVRLFPNALQSDSLVHPGETISVPPPGQGTMTIEAPAGKRRIRVLLFPPNVDPLAGQAWDVLQRNASSIDRQFEVRP